MQHKLSVNIIIMKYIENIINVHMKMNVQNRKLKI